MEPLPRASRTEIFKNTEIFKKSLYRGPTSFRRSVASLPRFAPVAMPVIINVSSLHFPLS